VGPVLRRGALLGATAGVVLAGDLVTKALAIGHVGAHQPTWLLGTVIGIDAVAHQGLRQGNQAAFGALAAAFLLAMAVVCHRYVGGRLPAWVAAFCGAALGGIVANNVDQGLHGTVTDWLLLQVPRGHSVVINLADAAIAIGSAGAMVLTVVGLAVRRLT
jgi:lipoprotein signal peptidase